MKEYSLTISGGKVCIIDKINMRETCIITDNNSNIDECVVTLLRIIAKDIGIKVSTPKHPSILTKFNDKK